MKRGLLPTVLLLVVAVQECPAWAQGYPSRTIRVIDAYPPGGTTDVVARIISPRFAESTGQSWVIDSRPGAQGIIGTDLAAKAPADGYTLLMFTASHTIHPSFYRNLPYDFVRAFAPVTLTSGTTNTLVVNPRVPAKNVKELVALARARPGQLNFASAGLGSTNHLATELLKSMTGISLTHIPYKGSAPAVIDVIGGQVDFIIAPMPVVLQHVKSGKLRALAVSTSRRAVAMPDVPTIAESGFPGYEATNSVGVLAPAGTPREIVTKLNGEIVRALNLPEVRDRLLSMGAEPVGNTPEQFGEYIRAEIAKWAKVIRETGMAVQQW
ncbi:MAG TPA: tripartite tricarboxylate transporter substrate binding protein [Burkholderiales bacterium]|nr:tripartite tricarboxylate transporter substrate binding protein [Burkholderiales bacterium]